MEVDFGIGYRHPKKDTVIKVTMNEFRGQIYVHIREYYVDIDTGVCYPTKTGYAILAEELDSVIELLSNASEYLGEKFHNKIQGTLDLKGENE